MESDYLNQLKVDSADDSPGERFKQLVNDLHQTRNTIENLNNELKAQRAKEAELEKQIQIFYADFMGLPSPVANPGGYDV